MASSAGPFTISRTGDSTGQWFVDLTDLPAFRELVLWFHRWQEEEGLIEKGAGKLQLPWTTIRVGLPAPTLPPTPAPAAFILNVPLLDPSNFPQDRQECGICYQKFSSVEEFLETTEGEPVAGLPCGHIVGHICLRLWVLEQLESNNTCPFCRAIFFRTTSR